ncbi:MAG: hypothetical protein HYR90_04015 [Candidatus Andersenbacteria bacterium]|nr:hypothetical protein [Candidatus Andersenbacteria bacterium]MBI3251255.1 hypothetical protein [Candidatus Andersenbacteria bacterium]
MSDKFALDVVQAAELKYAFERNGFTNADVKKMSSGDLLGRLLPVIRGNGEVNVIKHLIDLDGNPFVPDGWKVEEHRKGGQLEWDPKRIQLYLSEHQKKGYIRGERLREELADKPTPNANLLDYLLAHPHLIPEEWKGKAIFFWGTIYRRSVGSLCVRCLYWLDSQWFWGYRWLGYGWNSNYPAALLAS